MRLARNIFIAVVVLVVALGAAGWLYLRQSLPQLEGEARVPGLSAAVEIARDKEGVPHITAAAERDGWFAMGYVHAQDRLWQMEFQRRIGEGRLAEFLGERAYDVDRLMRTLGIARLAQRIVARLDAGTVANLEAYAAGVNAYLDEGHVVQEREHRKDCWRRNLAWFDQHLRP